jgi:hypothetical protein
MAYATSNPPALIAQGIGGANRLWIYSSVDAATLVRVAGYFTDGWSLGMRAGDLVIQIDSDASPITMQLMIVTSASATAGVDLSDGTAVTGTDSD